MTREDILARIGSILDELKSECRSLYIQPTVQVTDLELFEVNSNFLREHILILKKVIAKENETPLLKESNSITTDELLISKQPAPPVKKNPTKLITDEPVITDLELAKTSPVFVPETIDEEEIEIQKEEKPFISEVPKMEFEPVKVEGISEKVVNIEEPVITLEEKLKREEEAWAELNKRFQTDVPSLNEKISSINKDKTELNATISAPITDLKKAIGLNDKFAFIKGLFGNSVEAFEKSINKLNECATYEEANTVVEQQLAPKYDWKTKPELQEQLMVILKKRFIE